MSISIINAYTDENGFLYGMDHLPDELIIAIFKFLPLDALVECESVCRRWKKLARDVTVWRRLLVVYSGKPGQTEISEKNLHIITTHKECIHRLKLQYIYSYPIIKSVIDKCENLTSLELVMCRVDKEFEADIKRWPALKKFSLKNSLLIQNNENMYIEYDQFKNLGYLALSDFGLSTANCDTLLRCFNLSHIYIEKIKGLSLKYIEALIVSKKEILDTFHIYGGDSVNDKCLCLLSQCPKLKDLAIIRCSNLTDKGLVSLIHLQQIQHLQLWNNVNFTEQNLWKTLSSTSLTNLKSLSLSRIDNISPVIVDIISEYYRNLKFLAVYQCPRIVNTDYERQLKSKFRDIDVVLY